MAYNGTRSIQMLMGQQLLLIFLVLAPQIDKYLKGQGQAYTVDAGGFPSLTPLVLAMTVMRHVV